MASARPLKPSRLLDRSRISVSTEISTQQPGRSGVAPLRKPLITLHGATLRRTDVNTRFVTLLRVWFA